MNPETAPHVLPADPDRIPDVLVISGEGRYGDPWHDFVGTSTAVAHILRDHGLNPVVCGTDSEPPQVAEQAVIVVNAGGGGQANPGTPGDAASRWCVLVMAHLDGGGPVLALHTATNTFYDEPRWPQALGGRWVPGTSMHPPLDVATVRVLPVAHPITSGLSDFQVRDERYSHLSLTEDIVPLVSHRHDGLDHPIIWTHQAGAARVVVDTFGHDVDAYGPTRARLLCREVDWLRTGAVR
ncbi:MAG: ThuA domain-containing protein [Beutenbergiaceae bacterium]